MSFRIERADLSCAEHAAAWTDTTNAYALDSQGRGAALEPEVLQRSVEALVQHPTYLGFLAWDAASGEPAGLVTCFRAWGTFAAKPLINVHDLAVKPGFRGCAARPSGADRRALPREPTLRAGKALAAPSCRRWWRRRRRRGAAR